MDQWGTEHSQPTTIESALVAEAHLAEGEGARVAEHRSVAHAAGDGGAQSPRRYHVGQQEPSFAST